MKNGDVLSFAKADGFEVPLELVGLTGCPAETFESYGNAQFKLIQSVLDISPGNTVFEIGCGVGRLAIPATRFLRTGYYAGLDIIKPSIDWCSANITPRHSNFQFFFEDVHSPLHNPKGRKRTADVSFPMLEKSVDRIILSSVFTHMLPEDLMHYLSKMNRVLKPNGLVLTTMFLLNEQTLAHIENATSKFSFSFQLPQYKQCRLGNPDVPEGAIAYFEASYLLMLHASGFELKSPIRYGQWSGVGSPEADGQDYVVFGKALRH